MSYQNMNPHFNQSQHFQQQMLQQQMHPHMQQMHPMHPHHQPHPHMPMQPPMYNPAGQYNRAMPMQPTQHPLHHANQQRPPAIQYNAPPAIPFDPGHNVPQVNYQRSSGRYGAPTNHVQPQMSPQASPQVEQTYKGVEIVEPEEAIQLRFQNTYKIEVSTNKLAKIPIRNKVPVDKTVDRPSLQELPEDGNLFNVISDDYDTAFDYLDRQFVGSDLKFSGRRFIITNTVNMTGSKDFLRMFEKRNKAFWREVEDMYRNPKSIEELTTIDKVNDVLSETVMDFFRVNNYHESIFPVDFSYASHYSDLMHAIKTRIVPTKDDGTLDLSAWIADYMEEWRLIVKEAYLDGDDDSFNKITIPEPAYLIKGRYTSYELGINAIPKKLSNKAYHLDHLESGSELIVSLYDFMKEDLREDDWLPVILKTLDQEHFKIQLSKDGNYFISRYKV